MYATLIPATIEQYQYRPNAAAGLGCPAVRRVLAVDGGNTKTIAVVVSGEGIHGIGRGAGSDIYGTGSVERGTAELARTIDAALAAAGVSGGDLGSVVCSLAGADWPEDNELLASFVRRHTGVDDVLVVNDAIGGLRSGSASWEGIAVVIGTANAVGARNGDGRVFHLGFWPDRTGSYDLSVAALQAVYRDGLALGPTTSLTARVLDVYGADDVIDLMHRLTRREGPARLELTRLCPLLLDEADGGDAVAAGIITDGGRAVGRQAAVAADRVGLGLEGTPVVLSGGVLSHPSGLLAAAIMEQLPGAVAVRSTAPPVVGPILLALDRAGATGDADELARALADGGSTAPAEPARTT
jgi:N-acetylglucosamine kinase-like BadF-type ATPase